MNIDEPEGVLAALSPPKQEIDTEWSNATLQAILAETSSRRRRPGRRGVVAGGIVAALIAGGGVAYAQGTRPPWVSTAAQRMTDEPELRMARFVELELPDGSRFAAWRGSKGAALCDASADNWDGGEKSFSGGVSCNSDATRAEKNSLIKLNWAAAKMPDLTDDTKVPARWYPILYGFVADQRITEARVVGQLKANGEPVNLTLNIDPTTRAFSTVLPGSSPNPWSSELMQTIDSGLTVELLDDSGTVVSVADVY